MKPSCSPLLFVHPTGNANVRHAALGLHRAGCLGEFHTTIHHRQGSLLDRILPGSLKAQLRRRSNPEELQALLRGHPLREYARLLVGRFGLGHLARHEHGWCSIDAVYRQLDRQVARRLRSGRFGGVYAYEDGAAYAFAEARKRGLRCLYDLPIGYWKAARDIMLIEAELEPDWACTISGNLDSEEKTARKDEELKLADAIYVASSFTKSTLEKAPFVQAPVHVIPYGSPLSLGSPVEPPQTGAKLKALYVGSLGQRKGLSYLFKACRLLGPQVELTVIGREPENSPRVLKEELARIHYIPSCPHAEVLRRMRESDVFLFPSLFEGFGLVLLEAMAMGLPIIATPNTAGPNLITDGVEGFIVPIRAPEQMAERMSRLLRQPGLRRDMGVAAARKASAFTWENYENKLAELVLGTLP